MLAVLAPNFVFAGQFSTVENLAVYPNSEIVNFLTSVGSSETREILIENTGVQNYTVNVESNLTSPFKLEGNKLLNINAQSTKTLKVTFEPSVAGNYEQELKLKLNQTGETKTVVLKAHAREQITNEGIKLSAKNIKLEKTPIGGVSKAQVLLSNTNSYDVKIYASQLPTGEISIDDKIPAVVKSGESITINVSFKPKSKGLKKATLAIKTTDYKKSYLFTQFMGTAIDSDVAFYGGKLELAQNSLNLGNVLLGTQIMQTIQVRNTGNQTVEFKSVKKFENPIKYKLPNLEVNVPRTLSKGQTGEIKVVYKANKLDSTNKNIVIENTSINMPNIELNVFANVVTNPNSVTIPQAPNKLPEVKKYKTVVDKNTNNVKAYGYSKSVSIFNPDINQKVLFGLNLSNLDKPENVTLKVTNKLTKQVVYNTRYNNVLPKIQTLSWNGKNTINDLVSKGEYKIEIIVGDKLITDTVSVYRTYQPKTYYKSVPVELNPEVEVYNTYIKPVTPKVKSIDESLLTQVSVNPIVLNSGNAFVSFNSKQTAKATIEIVQNQAVKKTVFENRYVTAGFHYNVGEFTAQDLEDGKYEVVVSLETKTTKDTDIIRLYITAGRYSFNYYNQEIAALVHDGPKSTESQLAFIDFFTRKNTSCLNAQDIDLNEQLCLAYKYAIDKKIVSDKTYFQRNNILTRAEAIKMIVSLNNLKLVSYNPYFEKTLGFSDLNENAWYMPYLATLVKSQYYNGTNSYRHGSSIIRGYKDGTFKPSKGLSRSEFYKLIIEGYKNSNFMQLNTQIDYYVQIKPFADTSLEKENQWYLPYAQIVKQTTHGTEFAKKHFGTKDLNNQLAYFDPAKKITREEIIEFIYLAANKGLVTYY